MKKNEKISLVILNLNEIVSLKLILPELLKYRNLLDEIIAIDGGSTDGSREFLLKNKVKVIDQDQKYSLLIHILKYEPIGLGIIFCNRQDTADWIYKNLRKDCDFEVELLHGETGEGKRKKILQGFKDQQFDILVTTDIAARGLDVEHISHVFNYTLPKDANKYIHRIGRTARAGAQGKVINFVAKSDIEAFVDILKEHEIAPIFKQLPEFKLIEPKKEYTQKKNRR